MDITQDLIAKALKAVVSSKLNSDDIMDWSGALSLSCSQFNISNERRLAAFLGNCAVESNNFLSLRENLNYSVGRLPQVWSVFRKIDPSPYANNPEKLASFIYANKLGNGNELSGDGWVFRGGGLEQLTGKSNYLAYANDVGMSLSEASTFIDTMGGAADTAAWFFDSKGCNELADNWMLDAITLKINGRAMLGAVDRKNYSNAVLKIIQ